MSVSGASHSRGMQQGFAVGTIWVVHIGADRALGYGLKYAEPEPAAS